MSSADVAVNVFRKLENEDFQALHGIEAAMSKREFVSKDQIAKYVKLPMDRVDFTIGKLNKLGLIYSMRGAYVGYALNYASYDCLAINAFVKSGLIDAFGQTLGVGKEADVYDALTPTGTRIAIKFQRLGRISFRQTRRKRGYAVERASWLFQSRLAAEREFHALKLVYRHSVAVPEPLNQNRHAIAMGMIDGAELAKWRELPEPKKVLKEILRNVKKAYVKARIIHADLSEYNIILKPNMHMLIIDWPQYVVTEHPNAQELLTRDIENVLTYFSRKYGLNVKNKEAYAYVTGKGRVPAF